MSTRSGKRIHNSFHDDTERLEPDLATKSERKTRSKCVKEIHDQLDVYVSKSKKRENYVSYPTDDEHVGDTGRNDAKHPKKTRRNTLKEQNINIQGAETEDIFVDTNKPNRVTRQRRKLAENNLEDVSVEDREITAVPDKKKNKKSKKKTKRHAESLIDNGTDPVVAEKSSKKSKKIKSHSNSITKVTITDINKSNISTDSFHSAAGSPLNGNIKELRSSIGKPLEDLKVNTTFEIENDIDTLVTLDTTSKKKSSVKNSTFDKIDFATISGTLDKNYNTPSDARKSSIKNSTFDKIDCPVTSGKTQNTMFNHVNSTNIKKTNQLYTAFETEPKTSSVIDSITTEVLNKKRNNIFEKATPNHSKTNTIEATFDTEIKLNSTYDKIEVTPSKSSLISSDSTGNETFDKSNNSRISITSDDSKTENIINTTTVLIESSMDEPKHSEEFNMSNKTKTPDKTNQKGLPSLTPLKREGTFTKEGPEVSLSSPKPKMPAERTPTKRMSLPSPGFTPYRISQICQSSQKKKSLLNVTRSIEKPARRSSLAESVPRQMRVMFCSPVNNPGVMTQQKKKVIKSSMKGSNKSFLFEDNKPPVRTATRKRSLTVGDAQDSRPKRQRFADGQQQSVDRLSRPRTSSASAKLGESTPARKPVTPSKTRSDLKRTKLPNFAALHRKQFDKMESLDECQLRKARRARQLLTPSRGAALGSTPTGTSLELEITSTEPKVTSSETKGSSTETKQPLKEKETKQAPNLEVTLPTLQSLRPGFTRFGFRMNCDANPFIVTKTKTVKEKANGLPIQMEKTDSLTSEKGKFNSLITNKEKPSGLTKQLTQPSSNGATISRKAVAKQTVMREKSLTSLSHRRDTKRNENRTIIKGVRTNRRFELQMQMRNLD